MKTLIIYITYAATLAAIGTIAAASALNVPPMDLIVNLMRLV